MYHSEIVQRSWKFRELATQTLTYKTRQVFISELKRVTFAQEPTDCRILRPLDGALHVVDDNEDKQLDDNEDKQLDKPKWFRTSESRNRGSK